MPCFDAHMCTVPMTAKAYDKHSHSWPRNTSQEAGLQAVLLAAADRNSQLSVVFQTLLASLSCGIQNCWLPVVSKLYRATLEPFV